MQDIGCKLSRTAAVVVILLAACAGSAWASGVPWQVGDIVVCYGVGTCNVIRLHGSTVQVLDTISSGLLGNNGGVGLNNTLHVLATDDGNGTTHSNVVVYSIASIQPFLGTILNHSVINTYNGTGNSGDKAAAVAVSSGGHIFVGNSNAAGASIVELPANGTPTASVFTFPTSGPCATTTLTSLDLGANLDAIYVTAGDGIIRKVTLPLSANSCSQFANFGSLVNLYGIKDIPAGALSGTCNGSGCPAGESLLVVAKGFTDPDADTNETGETPPSPNDPDAVNICTNQMDKTPVSCGLLLDTAGAGLNAQPWVAKAQYFDTNMTILDPHGHVQQVLTPGTAGANEPNFGQSATTIDNAVKWTDVGQGTWQPNNAYSLGALPDPSVPAVPNTYFVDQNGNLETVTALTPLVGGGMSGNVEPGMPGNPVPWGSNDGDPTIDGLQWQDQGGWQPGHIFSGNDVVADVAGHLHGILTPGTSGSTQPTWVEGGTTQENPVTWTDQGNWQPSTQYYSLTQVVGDTALQLHKVKTPGTSGAGPKTPFGGWQAGTTNDNEVIWTDLGFPGAWASGVPYSAGVIVQDGAGHVQQEETSSCTSGSADITNTQPLNGWNDSGGTTPDGGCTWQDLGVPPMWAAAVPYGFITGQIGQIVVDPLGHIEQVNTAGVSGEAKPNTIPAQPFSGWNTGGQTIDGLTWTNEGTYAWQANHSYTQAANSTDHAGVVVDPSGHVQEVVNSSDAGTSGAYQPGTPANVTNPPPNPWMDGAPPTFGGKTIDGLQWTDQGLHPWQGNNHPYITLGELISDQQGTIAHVQRVYEAGKSRAGTTPPTFNQSGKLTVDNAVTWTKEHPKRAPSTAYILNAIVLDTFSPLPHVQQVSLPGTTGPADPFPGFKDDATTSDPDGLQWTDKPNPSVLARYPAPAGVTALQSLALDPLVSNCTGGNPAGTACSTGSLPTRMVTDSNALVTPSFWMGGTAGGTIYRQNFAGGTAASFDAATGGSGVQSLVVYGGESANQPGLASLVLNGSLTSSTNTAKANFLGNSILSTLSNNNGSALTGSTPISLYASAVDPTSCFNDPSAGSIGCKPFNSSPSQALVLKLDIPLNGNAALLSTQTLNTAITPPTGFFDNGTDVFVDEQFDDTTFVGGDPGTRTVSVHSLHEITVSQGGATCTYSSPLQNGCYKTNRGTLNFIFTCTGLTQTQFQNLQPVLSLVKKNSGQAPLFIPLQGTNGKAPYRFNATQNFWTFQWNLNGATAGKYQGTTFDNSGTVQSFPVTFNLKTSCP